MRSWFKQQLHWPVACEYTHFFAVFVSRLRVTSKPHPVFAGEVNTSNNGEKRISNCEYMRSMGCSAKAVDMEEMSCTGMTPWEK